jgi:hypothetical protein
MGYGYMIDVTAPTTETDAQHETCDASGSGNPEQNHDYVGPAGLHPTGHEKGERLLQIRLDKGEHER